MNCAVQSCSRELDGGNFDGLCIHCAHAKDIREHRERIHVLEKERDAAVRETEDLEYYAECEECGRNRNQDSPVIASLLAALHIATGGEA